VNVVGVVAGIVVGAVLAVAGGMKLAAGRAWLDEAAGLGVPVAVALPVPIVEIALGAALVVGLAMPWSAVAAIALLMAFSVLIARQLADGRHPPCACFGGWSHRPLDGTHLARNLGLVALAAVALWR